MALKQVKNKIVSTKKTGQVTKAMESVSAVKMRKSQERALAGRHFVNAALRILQRFAISQEGLTHPFVVQRKPGKRLLVIVTSDKGLAGSVNSAVLKLAEQAFKDPLRNHVIAVGRKAVEFAHRNHKEIVAEYTNVNDQVMLEDVALIVKTLVDDFKAGLYSEVDIIYQNFVSTFEQTPTIRRVLPLAEGDLREIMKGLTPKSGKWSSGELAPETHLAYQVEPSVEEVLDVLVPQLVQVILYHALLESKASEHSARMVAMKNATDKSKEVVKALTIKYNKARQAAITAEVSEITAGVEAMK